MRRYTTEKDRYFRLLLFMAFPTLELTSVHVCYLTLARVYLGPFGCVRGRSRLDNASIVKGKK